MTGPNRDATFESTTLLPGEDPAAFEKFHEQLTAELAPAGPLEQDIVGSMARLVWRRQNLATFRTADLARKRLSEIKREDLPGALGADVAQYKRYTNLRVPRPQEERSGCTKTGQSAIKEANERACTPASAMVSCGRPLLGRITRF